MIRACEKLAGSQGSEYICATCDITEWCRNSEFDVIRNHNFAFVFFGIAGLLSAFVAPIENHIFSVARSNLLSNLPIGFDWTDYEYLKFFSKPIIIFTCVYYGIFNALIAPITEELFFRGYLTSHYKKQNSFTPILIAVLFSLYHFWLPFNNVFRILAFVPVAYVAYKKQNLYISIYFHCLCNLFSVIGFVLTVLG